MTLFENAEGKTKASAYAPYSDDFLRWCFDQAGRLKARQFAQADLANIVEDRGAVLRALGQTDLPRRAFPADCPYTVEQLRDPDWMPE